LRLGLGFHRASSISIQKDPPDARLNSTQATSNPTHPSRDAPEQAGDVFRQAVACLVRNGRYGDAAALLMRFGTTCDAVNARSSQCKAYLGAVVCWLYAQDAAEAWRVFQDAMGVDAFSNSDEAFAADALFLAYGECSADKVKSVVQVRPRGWDARGGRGSGWLHRMLRRLL